MAITDERHPVFTDKAPKPLAGAPYSQAIATRGLVFVSGQVPLDPATGEIVSDDPAEQATQCMRNVQAVLEAAGSSVAEIAKTTIYLTDLGAFGAVNEAYGRFFDGAPPARATVEVSALPAGASVEIDAIAMGE